MINIKFYTLMRTYYFYLSLLILLAFSTGCREDVEQGPIPRNLAYYSITISGQTFEPFSRTGCLIVSPQIVPAAGNINFNNGPNARDIGLFSGSPIVGQAGAIWFGTNTSMCELANIGCNIGASGLDIAFVTADETTGTLNISLDGQIFNVPNGNAITGTLNIFNWQSGVTAQIINIVQGTMSLRFSADAQSVTGEVRFTGYNIGTVPYHATISGTRVNSCQF